MWAKYAIATARSSTFASDNSQLQEGARQVFHVGCILIRSVNVNLIATPIVRTYGYVDRVNFEMALEKSTIQGRKEMSLLFALASNPPATVSSAWAG